MKTKSFTEIAEEYGIVVDSERLTDGSVVWNLLIGEECVPCVSEKHARESAEEIGEAIAKGML